MSKVTDISYINGLWSGDYEGVNYARIVSWLRIPADHALPYKVIDESKVPEPVVAAYMAAVLIGEEIEPGD